MVERCAVAMLKAHEGSVIIEPGEGVHSDDVYRAPVTPVPHTYMYRGVHVKIMYECMNVCVYVICNNVGGTGHSTLFLD